MERKRRIWFDVEQVALDETDMKAPRRWTT